MTVFAKEPILRTSTGNEQYVHGHFVALVMKQTGNLAVMLTFACHLGWRPCRS